MSGSQNQGYCAKSPPTVTLKENEKKFADKVMDTSWEHCRICRRGCLSDQHSTPSREKTGGSATPPVGRLTQAAKRRERELKRIRAAEKAGEAYDTYL